MHRFNTNLAPPYSLQDVLLCGGAFDGRCACDGLLVAADDLVSLLSEEEGGAEGGLLGAGEETQAEEGGHLGVQRGGGGVALS